MHTPGPWKFKTDHLKGDCGIHAEGTGIFAEAFTDIRHAGEGNRTEALANARLIAAAPDLLDALKGLLSSPTHEGWQGEARAAIAKAEGRS
uniref:Uncharacterized protein n=1 Tax=Rhizobium leguminosarum TaxID=384 RepID=A0A179BVG3_RHILE|nr:hypothetical protein A4U53_18185 [Rhizobium leguminosarum]